MIVFVLLFAYRLISPYSRFDWCAGKSNLSNFWTLYRNQRVLNPGLKNEHAEQVYEDMRGAVFENIFNTIGVRESFYLYGVNSHSIQ